MELKVGSAAPEFTLPDQNDKIHSLAEFRGRWVVLYFYPKDNTPGCTKEACGFRDTVRDFADKNAVILGVSKDSVVSHQKFIGKYKLNFPLLSDESKKVIQMYGAWGMKKFMGREFAGVKRITYLINPEGIINHIYLHVDPVIHAAELIKEIG
jgi:thioredoxin-dependent peroxiredoxin